MSGVTPVEVVLTSDRFETDPIGREFAEIICGGDLEGQLSSGVLYYDFPTYADYEAVAYTPTALLLSPRHGIVAVRAISQLELASGNLGDIHDIESSINQFCSILIGRLLKSRLLRRSVSSLRFEVRPLIYAPGVKLEEQPDETSVSTSAEHLREILTAFATESLDENQVAEARSVIEGAKAIVRTIKRVVEDPTKQVAAVALAKLETEIANFDQKQRRAALSTVPGAQRIRGLAGSGKTIILAMKAANLHAKYPDSNILVTFYTKSLKETIRALITRFYRHYRDVDPDWDRVHVLHGWGGARVGGVYSDAARRASIAPMNLQDAKAAAHRGEDAFEAACRVLLETKNIIPYYDYCLIDEGQDFPASFYRLAYAVTKGTKDRKSIIWAYDELQNILNIKLRSPEELFGMGEDGTPLVSLERAVIDLPRGAENDVVLSKCYRNQREVLMVAHCLGFGIYSNIVQLLESAEHWEDVGYRVEQGDISQVGSHIVIERPSENSPLSIGDVPGFPVIACEVANDLEHECRWAVQQIRQFITAGLRPQDILIVTLDDRASRTYFKVLSEYMAHAGIGSHNLLGDPYSDPPFFIEDKVTLSTIYRAKGNEASAVIAMGIDATASWSRQGRNKLFTAFTRSKAWLRVSGIGQTATSLIGEISIALSKVPNLEFTMPDLEQVELIQRDLTRKQAEVKKIREEYLRRLKEQGFSEDEARDFLEEGDQRGTPRFR